MMNRLVYNRYIGISTAFSSSQHHHRVLLNNRSCLQLWMQLYSTQQHSSNVGYNNSSNNNSNYSKDKIKKNKYSKINKSVKNSNQHKHHHQHMTTKIASYTKPELTLNFMSSDEINEELKNNISIFMSFIKQIDEGLLFNIKSNDNDDKASDQRTMNIQGDSSSNINYLSQLSDQQIDLLMSHILSSCNRYKEESSTYYSLLMYCLLSIPSGRGSGRNDYKLSSVTASEDMVKLLKYGKLEVRYDDLG